MTKTLPLGLERLLTECCAEGPDGARNGVAHVSVLGTIDRVVVEEIPRFIFAEPLLDFSEKCDTLRKVELGAGQ